jgi:general secretion pathway protein A
MRRPIHRIERKAEMYEEYYGFNEKPFSLTPDPKYLYKSESHANAFELLQYAIRRREGFVVVTGDIGTGKTTLCRALLEQIDRKTFTALVLNPFLSEDDLLKLILLDFGVVSREEVKHGRLNGVSKQELIDSLYDFLLGLLPLHASAVLIIDEAQNLPLQVLEQIRILSNLETDKEKLLQIVLVGQLNLQPLLRSPELRQLDQRVSIRYELKPLSQEEVTHRLMIAGGASAVTFAPKALTLVHRLSGGIPRLVNLICDRALLAGFSARTSRIVPEIVEKAAESLELRPVRRRRFGWLRRAFLTLTAFGALAVLSGLAVTVGAKSIKRAPAQAVQPFATPQATAPPAASPPREPAPVAPPEPIVDRRLPAHRPYTIFIESFPLDPPERASRSAVQVTALTRRLEMLGLPVYHVDVALGDRGTWRRVLVGAYSDMESARRDESRLKVMHFSEARGVATSIATSGARDNDDIGPEAPARGRN